MFTKFTFALAFALAAASGALAATKTHSVVPSQNVYNPPGAYVGTDRDFNVRFELNRDWDRALNCPLGLAVPAGGINGRRLLL